MPSVGPTELILVLVIVLILFGPGKLTGLGTSLGKSIREFRKATTEPDEEEAEAKPADAKATVEEKREARPPKVTIGEESPTAAESADRQNKPS